MSSVLHLLFFMPSVPANVPEGLDYYYYLLYYYIIIIIIIFYHRVVIVPQGLKAKEFKNC